MPCKDYAERRNLNPHTHIWQSLRKKGIVLFFFFLKTKIGNKRLERTSLGLTRVCVKSPEQGKYEARGKEEGMGGEEG